MDAKQTMTQYLLAFVAGLKQKQVKDIVISPGSRSTPLALVLKNDSWFNCYLNVDERSASFFALGLAKAKNQAVGLVCTSGTAAANYYPAVCEAFASKVPLIVMTTDRPFEARNCNAPQTMNQTQLYGNHVKHFVELALPEATAQMLRYSFWQAIQAVSYATNKPSGPVHLNFPLREPLLPDLTAKLCLDLQVEFVDELPSAQLNGKKGLIIVGETLTKKQAQIIAQLAAKLAWPVVSDPLSNLSQASLKHADLIFSVPAKLPQPEVILRFGKLPVTKNVMLYLANLDLAKTKCIFFDPDGLWQDSLYQSQVLLAAPLAHLKQALPQLRTSDASWKKAWQTLEEMANQCVTQVLSQNTFAESHLTYHLMELLGADANLFVANSNAIRLVDRFSQGHEVSVYGNRGVNGIDGTVSTVLGLAQATQKPTYFLTGDLTLFHDLTGLKLAQSLALDVTLILLNNNGGGIFSFLPQKNLPSQLFEELFQTPLDLEGKKVAQLYDLHYELIEDLASFKQALSKKGPKLLELKTKSEQPVLVWQQLLEMFEAKL